MASTEYGNVVNADDRLGHLLDSNPFVITRHYTAGEAGGVAVLAVISCISALSLLGLLVAIAMSAWNTRTSTAANLFVRSHVVAYFLSLLLCEVAQTIGSLMSIRWVSEKAVSYEYYCTVQGVFKHLSDVGIACWSLIIAINTFWILFLRRKPGKFGLISTVVVGWGFIIAIVVSGPTGIQRADAGPFYSISGYWCWISNQYPAERITMDYMIMFLSAFLSFIMYCLVFFRLRGDILGQGWRLKVRLRHHNVEGNIHGSVDTHVINIARGMLLYPVAYTVLLLPIAACRFAEWCGHRVPFGATIFSDCMFLLSGFVNVVLFLTTRRVLPMHTILPKRVTTLFPSFDESFSATGHYPLASHATATQLEKPVVCKDADDARNQNFISHPPSGPLPHSPARAHTPFSPPSQYTGTSTSTSETFDPASQHRHSARAAHYSSEEADGTSALHDAECARSRVVSDPSSLMIFIPATALKER